MPVITVLRDKVTNMEIPVANGKLNSIEVDPEYYVLETKLVPRFIVSDFSLDNPIAKGDDLIEVYKIARRLNLPLWELTPAGKYRRIKPSRLRFFLWRFNNRQDNVYSEDVIRSGLQTLVVGCVIGILGFIIASFPTSIFSAMAFFVCAFLVVFILPWSLFVFIARLYESKAIREKKQRRRIYLCQ